MLLKSIDDISLVDDGVLMIGATNHPSLLDSAAWRRFDKIVMFPLPDAAMRKEIFEKIMAHIKGTFDTQKLAENHRSMHRLRSETDIKRSRAPGAV